MRLRIIAYGVAVLCVLLIVSIISFQMLDWRRPDPPSFQQLAKIVDAPDEPTRQRLADDALETLQVELSMYRADGSLLVSNVEPPLEAPPAGANGAGFPLRSRPSLEPLSFAPIGPAAARQRPGLFLVSGAAVVMRPAEAGPPLTRFVVPLLVSLVCLVLLSFPVTAAMTRKLEALAETARRFGEGDLSQRADGSGTDEVNRTARAFNLMAERIVELRQLERQLLANVSHELRTPMARMAVLLELTESKPAEATRYMSELAVDLRELESLLASIIETFRLDLASPRARELWLNEREALDLREVVNDVADDFSVQAPDACAITLDLPDEPVIRRVDRVLARRAVMNLLDNAHKYSLEGSTIELWVEPGGDIVVRDHGQGISEADLPYVFEPFFRADRTRSRKSGGLGLGLALVRMVAGFHNGAISVQSQPGRGSTFRLNLG